MLGLGGAWRAMSVVWWCVGRAVRGGGRDCDPFLSKDGLHWRPETAEFKLYVYHKI